MFFKYDNVSNRSKCHLCKKCIIVLSCIKAENKECCNCDDVISEDLQKNYTFICCKKRLCYSCAKLYEYAYLRNCPCCEGNLKTFNVKAKWKKVKCRKCNAKRGINSISPFCPDLYCDDCIKTIDKKNHICDH
ncbi:uncharacterized protein LOC126899950 isoform X2 [Daktulosphaira vitifoliae]|uniref:uncharacterized protein LOC126899950 isoform X2 n=1 Tax=Daktulosphaira vitifoliae TaxID=58002 RepID=UPI0021AA08FC|nr:uncharacterized protein LOC126899950 isoform X2 [Daktulosphaira vitifoliae]